MGAEHVAAVKVKIDPAGGKRGLKELDDETKRTAGSMKKALGDAVSAGMKGAGDAAKGMLSGLKSIMATAGGVLGGLGTAELLKGALEAKSKYSDLSAGIRQAGGSAKDAAAAQSQAQRSALAWAQDSMKVADAFTAIKDETGSIDYAQDSIDTVSEAARGAHKSLESMAAVTGLLNEKFGITAEQLPDALADVVGLSAKGGVGFEEMSEKLGLIGAYAKEAGLQGREGLGQIVGMLNLADNANGSFKKGISAVGGLLEQLSTSAGKNKLGAALGISQKDLGGNAAQQIEAIMRATKGQKSQLEKAFGGEQLKLLVDLGRTYAASFESTKGDVKTKTVAGVAALQESFAAASKSAVTWSDLQTEAAAQMKEAPQKIATATEKMRQAFQSERMQAAIGKFADKLPALADFIARLVSFTVDNPGAAIVTAITASIGKAAVGEAIGSLIKSAGSGAGIAGGIMALGVVALEAEKVFFDAKDEASTKTLNQGLAVDDAITIAKGVEKTGRFQSPEDQKQLAETTAALESRVTEAKRAQAVPWYDVGSGGAHENNFVMAAANYVTGSGPGLTELNMRDKDIENLPALEEQLAALKASQARIGATGVAPTGAAGPPLPASLGGGGAAAAGPSVDPATLAALQGQATGAAVKGALASQVMQVRVVGGMGPTGGGPVTAGSAPR